MISIITVTWKSKNDIVKLIESIKCFVNEPYEVIVVDNNSNDGTVEYLKQKYKEIKVIDSKINLGYAKGMNAGYELSSGEYIVFMNPDMELKNDIFKLLMDELDSDLKIGIIAPQLNYGDGTIQPTVKRDPSLLSQIFILLKLHHFIKLPILDKYLAKDFDYTKSDIVEQLMGAFIFTKRDRYEKFGPWDSRYPLWWEDVQLCKDSRANGFINVYYPSVSLIHYEGKSFAQIMSAKKQFKFNKGMRIYFLKNYGITPYVILILFHPISIFLARLSQCLKIKPRTQSQL